VVFFIYSSAFRPCQDVAPRTNTALRVTEFRTQRRFERLYLKIVPELHKKPRGAKRVVYRLISYKIFECGIGRPVPGGTEEDYRLAGSQDFFRKAPEAGYVKAGKVKTVLTNQNVGVPAVQKRFNNGGAGFPAGTSDADGVPVHERTWSGLLKAFERFRAQIRHKESGTASRKIPHNARTDRVILRVAADEHNAVSFWERKIFQNLYRVFNFPDVVFDTICRSIPAFRIRGRLQPEIIQTRPAPLMPGVIPFEFHVFSYTFLTPDSKILFLQEKKKEIFTNLDIFDQQGKG
jgi:hypothetical protein